MIDSELVEIISKYLNRKIEIKTKRSSRADIVYHGILKENNENEKYIILEGVKFGSANPSTEVSSAQIWYSVIDKNSIKEIGT